MRRYMIYNMSIRSEKLSFLVLLNRNGRILESDAPFRCFFAINNQTAVQYHPIFMIRHVNILKVDDKHDRGVESTSKHGEAVIAATIDRNQALLLWYLLYARRIMPMPPVTCNLANDPYFTNDDSEMRHHDLTGSISSFVGTVGTGSTTGFLSTAIPSFSAAAMNPSSPSLTHTSTKPFS